MTKSSWGRLGLAILIAIIFIVPELFAWKSADALQTPLRAYRGDTAHYLSILNAAQVNHGPVGNAYFSEWRGELSQFYLFQTVVAAVTFAGAIPVVWFSLLLKVLVATGVFYLLAYLFELYGTPKWPATFLSAAFVLLYGPTAFAGSATQNWFLPVFLLAVFLVARFTTRLEYRLSDAAFFVFSIFLFAIQFYSKNMGKTF